MGPLDGRVALVTGAGRGLGAAHARALAGAGALVVVVDVDPTTAAGVADEIRGAGGQARADTADLSTMAAAAAVVERAIGVHGRLDVLVNNAGISQRLPLDELDEATLDRHLAVHLKATVATMQTAFPAMRAGGGGAIVNTVSGAGLRPEHPGTTAYASAKAAVYAATLVAAAEGRPHGIRVNAVSPLAVTPMSAAFFARTEPEKAEALSPDRVAEVVVFLASDHAADVTGRILRVEGGHVSEAAMGWSAGADADHWTPGQLAARFGEIALVRS